MTYEQVKTEYCPASSVGIAGGDVRIIARSPKHILVYSYGETIATRETPIRRYSVYGDSIERAFGENFRDFVTANSRRGMGTTLVNGGGDPAPMARKDAISTLRDNNKSIEDALCPPQYRGCHICKSPLVPMRTIHKLAQPATLSDLIKMTNRKIVEADATMDGRVSTYWTWEPSDGYHDNAFCGRDCKIVYADRKAKEEGLY